MKSLCSLSPPGKNLAVFGRYAATAAEVAASINGWVRSLARRDRPLRDIDEALAGARAGLQADRGLRPHVGAGAGEPGDR